MLSIINVPGSLRTSIPLENETAEDDLNFQEIKKKFSAYNIYFRDPENCPFGRGNWILDFFENKEDSFPSHCIKLPKEMTVEQVEKYFLPLKKILTEIKRISNDNTPT